MLKNTVDWASRDGDEGSIRGKPVAMVGAGGRGGTVSAQRQLRDALESTGAVVMDEPHVFVAGAWDKFDSEGRLHDESTRTSLDALLAAFADRIKDVVRGIASPRPRVRRTSRTGQDTAPGPPRPRYSSACRAASSCA